MTRPANRALQIAERVLIGLGIALCTVWVAVRLHGQIGRRAGLSQFEEARSRARAPAQAAPVPLAPTAAAAAAAVDDRLWSAKRIHDYKETLGRAFPAPLAVLRIPRAGVEVPVLPGIDEATLNRAVGWIDGTARPGEAGNVGIAGHRDGFFRGLKDLAKGDSLTLETASGLEAYVVDDIRIVSPQDVSVLAATSSPTVTLVTCYPFYFVGDAPQRYIVRAVVRKPQAEAASLPR